MSFGSQLSALAIAIVGLWPGRAEAAAGPEAPIAESTGTKATVAPSAAITPLSLSTCLQLAETNYPKVSEALARVQTARAQLQETQFAPLSGFSANAGAALAPTVRGTPVFSRSTDESFQGNMGLAWQINVTGTIPIWTFGKLENAIAAARAQVQLKGLEVQQVKNELRSSVRQAFYGVQFATSALDLVSDAKSRIERELARLERENDPEADEIPVFKMRIFLAELTARRSEAERQQAIARASLRFLVGVPGQVEVVQEALPEPKYQLAPLGMYQSAAKLFRPELGMAKAGREAREALLRVEESKLFPDFGASLGFNLSRATEVTDQKNPFVNDPANFRRYGVGLGLKWNLDFGSQLARRDQAHARLDEVRATERFAKGGVELEVEKAYWEAFDAQKRSAAFGEAAQYARRWMVTVQQGIDLGTYESDDLVAASKEYALRRFSEMNATYDYVVALARLAASTGWEAVAQTQLQ